MAFLFRLETEDGAAADPARFETAEPRWRAGAGLQTWINHVPRGAHSEGCQTNGRLPSWMRSAGQTTARRA